MCYLPGAGFPDPREAAFLAGLPLWVRFEHSVPPALLSASLATLTIMTASQAGTLASVVRNMKGPAEGGPGTDAHGSERPAPKLTRDQNL